MEKSKQCQQEKTFVSDLKAIASEARKQAYRAADHLLVVRNWLIGWRIVEQEQSGKSVLNMVSEYWNWHLVHLLRNMVKVSD